MQILELLFGIFKKTSVLIHKLIPKQELLLQKINVATNYISMAKMFN